MQAKKLPVFRKVNSRTYEARSASGDVYQILKASNRNEFSMLSVNGCALTFDRSYAELVKSAWRHAA